MKHYHDLIEILMEKKLTIATAESCTGGLIAKLITDVPGSSDVFIGGIVSYANDMKKKWLGVKHSTLQKHGAVSEHVVEEMLEGIHRETGANLAVAVSGVAGPTGGAPDKPTGTVYVGVRYHRQQFIQRCQFQGSREEIRQASAEKALELIKELI